MFLKHFLTCLDSNEYQTLGILMFPHKKHVWFIGCVFNTPCPICAFSMHWSWHIVTSCTHLCYPCHALVYILFLHPTMSCLPYALQHLVMSYVLSFIFSFILHPSCIILLIYSFVSCILFSLTPLSICVKKGESILQSVYWRVFSFLYGSCALPLGEKFYFSCTFVGGEIFHRGDAYTKGEITLC